MVPRRHRVLGPGWHFWQPSMPGMDWSMNSCWSCMRKENQPAGPGFGPVRGVEPWQRAQRMGVCVGSKPTSRSCAVEDGLLAAVAAGRDAVHLHRDRGHRVGPGQFGALGVVQHHEAPAGTDPPPSAPRPVNGVRGMPSATNRSPRRSKTSSRVLPVRPVSGGQGHAEQGLGVGPEVGLAHGVGVAREGVLQGQAVGDHGRQAGGVAPADDLRLQGVVGGQHRQQRVVAVHAVHAQVVGDQQDVLVGLAAGRRRQGHQQREEGGRPGQAGRREAAMHGGTSGWRVVPGVPP